MFDHWPMVTSLGTAFAYSLDRRWRIVLLAGSDAFALQPQIRVPGLPSSYWYWGTGYMPYTREEAIEALTNEG